MVQVRQCLILLTVLGTVATGAAGQLLLENPERLTFDKNNRLSPFKSRSAKEMMTEDEYDNYMQALAKLDCDSAHKLLNMAFIRYYPQFERARLKPKCGSDRDCRYWAHYARVEFTEYGYCTAVVSLEARERELKKRNPNPPRFALKPRRQETVYQDRWIEGRDRALAILIGQAESEYTPALVKLAELVQRGDVFNASDETEYYILKRACHFDHDCAALYERLSQLRGRIAPGRATRIEQKAQSPAALRPILWSLLLGERL